MTADLLLRVAVALLLGGSTYALPYPPWPPPGRPPEDPVSSPDRIFARVDDAGRDVQVLGDQRGCCR